MNEPNDSNFSLLGNLIMRLSQYRYIRSCVFWKITFGETNTRCYSCKNLCCSYLCSFLVTATFPQENGRTYDMSLSVKFCPAEESLKTYQMQCINSSCRFLFAIVLLFWQTFTVIISSYFLLFFQPKTPVPVLFITPERYFFVLYNC